MLVSRTTSGDKTLWSHEVRGKDSAKKGPWLTGCQGEKVGRLRCPVAKEGHSGGQPADHNNGDARLS